MRMIRLAAAFAVLLVMSACVPLSSLNPLWDSEHVVSEPALIGTWASDDGEVIVIAEGDGNKYWLAYIDDNKASQYEAHAVRLEGRLFLDLYPDEDTLAKRFDNEAYMPLIPAHFFLRVVVAGDSLEIAVMDDDAVAEKLEEEDSDVPLVKSDDNVLLTAPTDTIQDFAVRLADDSDVWGEPLLFHRSNAQ